MKNHQQWLQSNDDYLRIAIRWVHLRLVRQIGSMVPVKAAIPEKKCWYKRSKSEPLSVTDPATKDAAIAETAKRMAVAEASNPPPALLILSQQLGLTRFERDLMLLCVAMELNSKTALLCAKAQNNSNKSYPTFALAAQLFDEFKWDALSADPVSYTHLTLPTSDLV